MRDVAFFRQLEMDIEIVRVACVATGLSCSGAEERGRTGDFVKNTYRKVGDLVMRGFPFRQEILSFLFDKFPLFVYGTNAKKCVMLTADGIPKKTRKGTQSFEHHRHERQQNCCHQKENKKRHAKLSS